MRRILLVLTLGLTASGCATMLRIEAPGYMVYYEYPALVEKHMEVRLPDGTVFRFDSEADAMIELARLNGELAATIAKGPTAVAP